MALSLLILALSVATVLVWRQASLEPPEHRPGTFFGALFLGGTLGPVLAALIVKGGAGLHGVVPTVLAMSLLLGLAARARPAGEWAERDD